MSKPTAFPAQKQSMPGHESSMHPKPEIIRSNYRASGKLEGKAAIITGGDSGIGRVVAVHFAKEGGVIINTTSVNAYKGNAQLLSYSTSKGAELAFTRSLASTPCYVFLASEDAPYITGQVLYPNGGYIINT